jgi:IclR family acetate operon transcriptional repressor
MPTSIQRAIAILDVFTLEQPENGVREIARRLDIHPSTVGRMLATLTKLGILIQNETNHQYRLGSKVLQWSAVYLGSLDLQKVSRPYMEELRKKTQESVSLYVPSGNERVLIERLDTSHFMRVVTQIGQRMPLYAGASGKVFLAFLPPQKREDVLKDLHLDRLTSKTIVDIEDLRKELLLIRKRGYAISHGERVEGVSSLSAPLFNFRNQVIGAISISGPSLRLSEEKITEFIEPIINATDHISQVMGNSSKEIAE